MVGGTHQPGEYTRTRQRLRSWTLGKRLWGTPWSSPSGHAPGIWAASEDEEAGLMRSVHRVAVTLRDRLGAGS